MGVLVIGGPGQSANGLGADLPLGDLHHAANISRVDGVVLSGSVNPAREILTEQLPGLVKAVGVPVFVGGLTSVQYLDEVVRAGAIPLGTEIEPGIRRISELLPAAEPA